MSESVKSFFEVFPGLKLREEERSLFQNVSVTRVSTTRAQDQLRIYIESDHLIDKARIFSAEHAIRTQLFPRRNIGIRIREQFHLSGQYDAQSLMELYLDSILTEFKEVSNVEYTLLRDAAITFPASDEMTVSLEDSFVGRERADEILRVLDKIINERCGLHVTVNAAFIKKEKDENGRPDGAEETPQTVPPPEEEPQTPPEKITPISDGKRRTARGRGAKGGAYRRFANAKAEDENLIYGRPFSGTPMPILDLTDGIGEVIIQGMVVKAERRDIKNDRTILSFHLTDFSDTVTCKIFVGTDEAEDYEKEIDLNKFLLVKGVCSEDRFDHEVAISSVRGVKRWSDWRTPRKDEADVKRVELHCHTKMSDMDGVSDVTDIVKRAYYWGMRGIAITDHGVAHAFPDAHHTVEKLYAEEVKRCKEAGAEAPDRQSFFKVIYGLDAYLVDDLKRPVENEKGQDLSGTFVVFDLETTGFSPAKHKIIEIGAVKMTDGVITDRFSKFVNPKVPVPFHITNLTGITDEMVRDAQPIEEVLPAFLEFIGDAVLVGHNVTFDVGFLNENCRRLGHTPDFTSVDTMALSRAFFVRQRAHDLEAVSKTLDVPLLSHHRAVDDAECTAQIFLKFLPMIRDALRTDDAEHPAALDGTAADQAQPILLREINEIGKDDAERIRRIRPTGATILATNTLGRVNLYTLISAAHLHYLNNFRSRHTDYPLIPKSLLMKYREGLLVGSGGLSGELLDHLSEERSEEELHRILEFYDFLEVQPPDNYGALLEEGKRKSFTSIEEVQALMRRVVQLGEQYQKLVVATSDAHFLDPEDALYRKIIRFDRDNRDETFGPLYLRTTKEMLDAFGFLGGSKAKEIVVTNTNRIFDMCEAIAPVRPDKCPPVIPDSDNILTELCENKAHEIYGEELPEVVKKRMERELHSIISNGFAVMYIIAQKLVSKSNDDGYLVGSRGSVGSSFAAFLSGITEVNSLSPHYVCPSCHYADFDSEDVKAYTGASGCDMPDKMCPKCGTLMKKDGFDIPFETFLGFKGDKEPDIDLNFSGDYQSNAHKFTEVIFGKGQTYRAGTIATLADKTAYGIVRDYYEERDEHKRPGEIERIVKKCTGIRRGTGQHPGGIIVLPIGEDIHSFTPVQHPANDVKTPIITTHFDYHSIDHNLLKLDILGHDDPTMLKFLQDITGVTPEEIPLDDREVMQLFADTSSLHITPQDIGGTKLGCLGLPEFGTDFAMQMVIDAKPTSFTHLIRIAGLAHGTNVWLDNAQTLIKNGEATIDTAICTRDDIMLYLIQKGMDEALSFQTMESVRKGKGLTPEMEEAMRAADVPEWYIGSCKKIKYMFPKAHAAAYVMMAWRIAWFKVHLPAAFYAAWFSIRAKAFDYEMMCQGIVRLKQAMAAMRAAETLSDVDANKLYTMRIIEEMYARGIEFVPIDIYRAKATQFQVTDDAHIMPAFTSLDKMGDKAAEAVEEAAAKGRFLSQDDFRTRSHCPAPIVEAMHELGLLGNLPKTNQISLFDLVDA